MVFLRLAWGKTFSILATLLRKGQRLQFKNHPLFTLLKPPFIVDLNLASQLKTLTLQIAQGRVTSFVLYDWTLRKLFKDKLK